MPYVAPDDLWKGLMEAGFLENDAKLIVDNVGGHISHIQQIITGVKERGMTVMEAVGHAIQRELDQMMNVLLGRKNR